MVAAKAYFGTLSATILLAWFAANIFLKLLLPVEAFSDYFRYISTNSIPPKTCERGKGLRVSSIGLQKINVLNNRLCPRDPIFFSSSNFPRKLKWMTISPCSTLDNDENNFLHNDDAVKNRVNSNENSFIDGCNTDVSSDHRSAIESKNIPSEINSNDTRKKNSEQTTKYINFSTLRSLGVDYGLIRTGIAITTGGYNPRPLAILSDYNVGGAYNFDDLGTYMRNLLEKNMGILNERWDARRNFEDDIYIQRNEGSDYHEGILNDVSNLLEDHSNNNSTDHQISDQQITNQRVKVTPQEKSWKIWQDNSYHLSNTIISTLQAERATQIVLGLPLHKNGTDSEQSLLTREFGKILLEVVRKRCGKSVDVILWDERYTSKEAASRITAEAMARNRRIPSASDLETTLDADAACIILEHYYQDMGLDAETLQLSHDLAKECDVFYQNQLLMQKKELERRGKMEETQLGGRWGRNARKDMIERAKDIEIENASGDGVSVIRKKRKKRKKK